MMTLSVLKGTIEARKIVSRERFACMTADERSAVELRTFREGDIIDPRTYHISYPRMLALAYDSVVEIEGLSSAESEAFSLDLQYFHAYVAPMRDQGRDIRHWYLKPPPMMASRFSHLDEIPPPPVVKRAAGAEGRARVGQIRDPKNKRVLGTPPSTTGSARLRPDPTRE